MSRPETRDKRWRSELMFFPNDFPHWAAVAFSSLVVLGLGWPADRQKTAPRLLLQPKTNTRTSTTPWLDTVAHKSPPLHSIRTTRPTPIRTPLEKEQTVSLVRIPEVQEIILSQRTAATKMERSTVESETAWNSLCPAALRNALHSRSFF